MTTTVTLKTHAWPVEVTTTETATYPDGAGHTHIATKIVSTDTTVDLYIHSTMQIGFKELPLPEAGG